MEFSNTTSLAGVIQTIEDMTDLGQTTISGDATLLKKFTSYVNQESRRIWATIFKANGNWQYDDGNNTDIPESATDLVSAQGKYALPTDALTVQKVDAKDSSGEWYTLTPITKEMTNESMDEFMSTNGQPNFYRLFGNTIELYPAPNYASTGGLKIYYDRDSFDFATTDTTKAPGFASPFHKLLPLKVAIYWLNIKQPTSPSLPGFRAEEQRMEADLMKFYGKRFKSLKNVVSRAYQSFK